MANASKKHGMGAGTVVGHPNLGVVDPNILDEDDLAPHIKGNNRLQGNDQSRVHNQRVTMPGSQDLRNQPDADRPDGSGTDDGGAIREAGTGGNDTRRS